MKDTKENTAKKSNVKQTKRDKSMQNLNSMFADILAPSATSDKAVEDMKNTKYEKDITKTF